MGNDEDRSHDIPAPIALTRATERLCENHNPATVSIRHIAAEAGLSSGLVYHYFGSREELFGATLQAMANEVAARSAAAETQVEMALAALDFIQERPAFSRIISTLTLEGRSVSELMDGHPFIEQMVAAEGSDNAAKVRISVVVGFLLSAGLFGGAPLEATASHEDLSMLRNAQANALIRLLEG